MPWWPSGNIERFAAPRERASLRASEPSSTVFGSLVHHPRTGAVAHRQGAPVSEPSQILRPAATVVVVRDAPTPDGSPGLETLMLRRNEQGTFGGMWVFPGGRVDAGDHDPG